ncbi:hypothetical protein OE903_14205 [Bacillus sp. B6(2022)]|nr:hypothetical protein [Bacillus sp. B6(2022)]
MKVQTVSGADSEWFTKLKASNGKNPPYDLLILQPDTIQRGIAANVLAPIDEDQAPNVKSFIVLFKRNSLLMENNMQQALVWDSLELLIEKILSNRSQTAGQIYGAIS